MIPESLFLTASHIKGEFAILFDLDGTLLDTNLANNEAYRYGLYKVTGNSDYPQLENLRRITRNDISSIDGITDAQLGEIIQYKRTSFFYKMRDGNISPFITFDILKKHADRNACYIITSAERERVQQIVRYYELDKYVKDIVYTSSDNKYDNIESIIGIDASKIILYEDDEQAIKSAIQNKIREDHIITVSHDTLKSHTIRPNVFLSKETRAFYSLDYLRYGRPGNPDFINTLKNTNNNCLSSVLVDAQKQLAKYLLRDIRSLYNLLGNKELVIVAIPRAKAEAEYSSSQQLFRETIKLVIQYIQKKYNLKIVDGSHYISRHTNTKTTHLSKNENMFNDGDMPYKGITKSTCSISDQVANKNILLIDDIYTFGVNIDEDAIQALYDNGAQEVIFYSVSKTYKTKK